MCCKKPRDQKQVIKKKQKIRNLCNAGVSNKLQEYSKIIQAPVEPLAVSSWPFNDWQGAVTA